METTSVSLLRRLQQPGDESAWGRFVDLYTPLLFRWAARMGLQDSDAADLVQEVLLLLLRKLPAFRYDEHKSFRAWLRTVTLNKWRERQRRWEPPPGSATVEVLDSSDPAEAFWEAEYCQHLLRRAVHVMQSEFQPSTWRAFWEMTVVGRPAAAVAAELGLSAGAVRVAKFRVLCRLRQELEGLLD